MFIYNTMNSTNCLLRDEEQRKEMKILISNAEISKLKAAKSKLKPQIQQTLNYFPLD